LTEELSEFDAVIVYDPSRLKRVSPNEYWFVSLSRREHLSTMAARSPRRRFSPMLCRKHFISRTL
jgi:hypothetical protein